MGQERPTPRRHRTAHAGRHHVRGKSPYRTATYVEQSGLAGQGLTVLDHDAVHAADLTRLRGHPDAAGRADQGERRLRSRAGDLQRARAARLGQRSVGQERAPPRRDRAARVGRDHVRGQPAHRTATYVEQSGLAGQRLTVLDHANDVVAALA